MVPLTPTNNPLPQPSAVGLTAVSQPLISTPPPSPGPGTLESPRKRIYTDSKIPYLNHIATGVVSLAENPWRLAKVDADDMLGLLHLLNRLPTKTLKVMDLADSLHQLLFNDVEDKGFEGTHAEGIRDYAAQKIQSYVLRYVEAVGFD